VCVKDDLSRPKAQNRIARFARTRMAYSVNEFVEREEEGNCEQPRAGSIKRHHSEGRQPQPKEAQGDTCDNPYRERKDLQDPGRWFAQGTPTGVREEPWRLRDWAKVESHILI
jgi:hypothetical protein